MAEGSDTYKGLAVPLFGDFEIKQRTAATDIMTITAASGASGDFIVCQTVGGGELFVVDASGNVTAGGTITSTSYVNIPKKTTAPTTGLTKGDIFLALGHTHPQLGVCISTAANTLWYITADTTAFGATTAD